MMLMFRYATSYRYYTLARIGFGLAYLWYIWDFFWIHAGMRKLLPLLLSNPSDIVFSGNPVLDVYLRRLAVFVSGKTVVCVLIFSSPLVVGVYLWGRHRWLQFGVGCWISISMISLSSLAGVFVTTADIWLHYVFLLYGLTALICSNEEWDRGEPGLNVAKWRENPSFASIYAWYVVLLQFTVYFYAGVNKLIHGWKPWMTGVALQNLAYDSSMHDFAWGIHVPYWLSLILCYVTLLQRLVVPFGFYSTRYRLWSVLILGTMHIGYAILMRVNLFPLVGIASLLMILPYRNALVPHLSARLPHQPKKIVPQKSQLTLIQNAVICIFSFWLVLEAARVTNFNATPWENKFMIVPAWRMFADGGVTAGGKWRIFLDTPQGTVDASALSQEALPHLWRDRFYSDIIFHELLGNDKAPAPLAARLLQATEQIYRDHQLQANSNPAILGYHFEIYRAQDKSIPNVGDAAPLVEGKNQKGQTWRLADDIGKKVVLLYFYPKDGTQGCTKEACGLRDRMGDLAKDNVEVIGVSFDSTGSHQAFISKYSLNFPLLADTDGKIADAYGVRIQGKSLDKRVSFLIGLDGKIAHVTDTPSADVHLAEMQAAVEKLPKNPH
jgi:peroxiredoxin Q/BCP